MWAARAQLVSYQIFATDEVGRNSVEISFHTNGPRVSELNAIDRRHDVHPNRWTAHLKESLRRKVIFTQVVERRPKLRSDAKTLLALSEEASYPNIELLRVTRFGVLHNGVRSHNEVSNFVFVENGQYLFEVWAHLYLSDGG